jgi:hypothetical protein
MENLVMTPALKYLALFPVLGLLSTTAAQADGNVPPDVAPPQVTSCRGAAQEGINGLTRNFPVTIPWAVAVPLEIPNTRVDGGPSTTGGRSPDDLYVVTFSAEADSSGPGGWTVQAQYSLNGGGAWINMPPIGPNTFHQGTLQETHTMTWCRRIQSANPVLFRVVADAFPASDAIVDDYTTLVERSD